MQFLIDYIFQLFRVFDVWVRMDDEGEKIRFLILYTNKTIAINSYKNNA